MQTHRSQVRCIDYFLNELLNGKWNSEYNVLLFWIFFLNLTREKAKSIIKVYFTIFESLIEMLFQCLYFLIPQLIIYSIGLYQT